MNFALDFGTPIGHIPFKSLVKNHFQRPGISIFGFVNPIKALKYVCINFNLYFNFFQFYHHKCLSKLFTLLSIPYNSFSAGIDYTRQNLTSKDVEF